MKPTRKISILVAVLLLAASILPADDFDGQVFGYEDWSRAVEKLGLDESEVVFPFGINDDMKAWAKNKTRTLNTASPELRLEGLQQAFFEKGEFDFEYEIARTLTAEEAFAARKGNCMSFTSLFVALARSIGQPAFLVAARRQPEVEKEGTLVVVNRHVVAGYRAPDRIYLYDFYVSSVASYANRKVIDDLGASALYHTNIGGREIRNRSYEEAVRHLEIATILEPKWAPAWVNLGVAKMRLGDPDAAMEAYRQALIAEEGNSSALINMSRVYSEWGMEEEARTAMQAAAEGTRNPFTLVAMADAEMLRGEYEEARQYLRRARWWYGKEPEIYDALARLAELVGDTDKARKHRERAIELRALSAQGRSQDSG